MRRGQPRRGVGKLRHPRRRHGTAEPRARHPVRPALREAQQRPHRPGQAGVAAVVRCAPLIHSELLVRRRRAGQSVGLGKKASPVRVLEIEDRVERPVQVIGEPGRLR
jgi:hypothetical protein